MSRFYTSLQYLYPALVPGTDWSLQDNRDGAGEFIRTWAPTTPAQPSSATVLSFLTDAQWAQYQTLPQPDALQRTILLDNGTFRFATLDECSIAAPTLRSALSYVFKKVSSDTKLARLRPQFTPIKTLFDMFGENANSGLNKQPELKLLIQNVDVSDDSELTGLKTQMLALLQWT